MTQKIVIGAKGAVVKRELTEEETKTRKEKQTRRSFEKAKEDGVKSAGASFVHHLVRKRKI